MKKPSRFISFCKDLVERLATLVLGSLAMIMVLYYAEISNPALNITRVERAIAMLEHVSRFVAFLTSDVTQLNLHWYV
jgi:hypothetical protein